MMEAFLASSVIPYLFSSTCEPRDSYVNVSDVLETGDLCACSSTRSDSDISSKLSVSGVTLSVDFILFVSGIAYAKITR